jgi:hypothetical protein
MWKHRKQPQFQILPPSKPPPGTPRQTKKYFYNKTTQIKPEYNHILELFKPYLICTQITTTNQHLAQFCINNNTCLESYLFYAILITLAPTPAQSNQLIAENSTLWTINLIQKLLENPNSLSSTHRPTHITKISPRKSTHY